MPSRQGRAPLALTLILMVRGALTQFQLKSNFGEGREYPVDHRGDEDNISPPLTWEGAPKNTQSFVLIVDSDSGGATAKASRPTHWLVYDIPKDVRELREELSGAGSSDVARLGMKEDAGQAPVVRRVPVDEVMRRVGMP